MSTRSNDGRSKPSTTQNEQAKAALYGNKRRAILTAHPDNQFGKEIVNELIEQLLTTYGPSVLCGLQIHFHTHIDQSVSVKQQGDGDTAKIDYNGSGDRSGWY